MEDFHRSTIYDRCKMDKKGPTFPRSETYKTYPGSEKVLLPKPKSIKPILLHDSLTKRRSVRAYLKKPLDLDTLSYLLWATSGINAIMDSSWGRMGLRTAPSAGACYPIETYIVVNQNGVNGLDHGIYHYDIENHQLEVLFLGNFAELVKNACLEQECCGSAPVIFVFTAIFNRTRYRYHNRGFRYIYLDAGHQAQNLALSLPGFGLGGVPIGAFYDDEINEILTIDGQSESTIYVYPVGCIK